MMCIYNIINFFITAPVRISSMYVYNHYSGVGVYPNEDHNTSARKSFLVIC